MSNPEEKQKICVWERRVAKFGLCTRCKFDGYDVLAKGDHKGLCILCSKKKWQDRDAQRKEQIKLSGCCTECNDDPIFKSHKCRYCYEQECEIMNGLHE